MMTSLRLTVTSRVLVVLMTTAVFVQSGHFPQSSPLSWRQDKDGDQQQQQQRDAADGFLPRTVWPSHYNLEIAPDFYHTEPPFGFSGTVEIFIRVTNVSDTVVLNSLNINIRGVTVVPDPNNEVLPPNPQLLQYAVDRNANFLTLTFADSLVVGSLYIITVQFDGPITASSGMRYEYYVDTDGSTKYLVTTQFQGIAARQVFPCFDESDIKATFNVTMLSRPPAVTLSNMPVIATEDRGNGWTAYVYEKSPIMSTYQVCLTVGDFQFVDAALNGVVDYPVRIYGRPQIVDQLGYSARVSDKIQAWFEQDSGIPYVLPKMDHIVYPIQGWAMENWGLITYGEYLCVDDEVSSMSSIVSSIRTISHEVAHQWYGNLMTMKTWQDTWLHEGFASYMQYYGLESLGWLSSELQQIDSSGPQQFLDTDQTNSSLPIRKIPQTIWDLDSMSAVSTYPKGGAIVRHLRGILSRPTLTKGLTNFLNKHSYSVVADTDDLWESLNAQAAIDDVTMPDGSALDLKPLMDAWLNQWGFPLVSVKRNGDGTATLTASQYIKPKGQANNINSTYNYRWNIPVTILTKDSTNWDPTPSFWLQWLETDNPEAILEGVPDAGDWFVINVKQMFFYRVDYDSSILNDITNQLNADHTAIPAESRSQLIDDAFTLSRNLELPVTQAMDLTTYLHNELFYNPWSSTLKHIRYLDYLLQPLPLYTNFRAYLAQQLDSPYQQQGWVYNNTADPLGEYMRRDMISNACYFGLSSCRDTARLEYQKYAADPDVNSVAPDNMLRVLCVGVSEGTVVDWAMVYNQYTNRKFSMYSSERSPYIYAMACTDDLTILERYLSYIVEGVVIESRDQGLALGYLTQNAVSRPLVWEYLKNSWLVVPSQLGKMARLRDITTKFTTESEAEEFEEFVSMYPPQTVSEANDFAMIRLNMRLNLDWLAQNADDLGAWLSSHVNPSVAANLQAPLPISPMDEWNEPPVERWHRGERGAAVV